MQRSKQKALEAAGWRFGDAADFLSMSNEGRQMLDLRTGAAMAVKRQRQAMKLSQTELGRRIHTSQPRIVKIEQAAKDVTLDQMLRAFAAAGGQIAFRAVAGAKKTLRGTKKGSPVQIHIELTESDLA
jgi:hypothetical protein